jgi:EAL domain-containing protein (putative c-di-GMP-specific phosphodiesterase class I)
MGAAAGDCDIIEENGWRALFTNWLMRAALHHAANWMRPASLSVCRST